MLGILNINKPTGWTSRDVVNRVQRLVRPAKVGHAGTLDPLATGVLVVCVGQATRLIEYVQRMPKRYVGTFQLGITSPSDDTETETTPIPAAKVPSLAELQEALPEFIGDILQRPPAYSAIKLQGRKAYELARKGEQVDLAPRPVTIHSIEIVQYEHPELVLDIHCGSGTYVRSLGRDLAETLDTGAVMSALVRTSIGQFSLGHSCTPEQVLEQGVEQFLEPAAAALANIESLLLSPSEIEAIGYGRSIERHELEAEEVAALDREGNLVAVLVPRRGAWGPKLVFKS